MNMQEFLTRYAANLLECLKDHSLRIDSFGWICDLCPLKEQCGKDSEENPCGQYIKKSITDGAEYKA